RWRYRQVAELAFRVAREIEGRRIGKGDHVVLWGDNCAEWAAAFFGCMLRGSVAVPIDRIAAPDFMQRVAGEVRAKLVICSPTLAGDAQAWPRLELENLGEMTRRLDSSFYPPAALKSADVAQIVFTSGTTAEPRGV